MNPTDFDETHEILLRLGMATLFGAILGIDRDLHQKPAGLRVLAMVCMAACAITMMSAMTIAEVEHAAGDGFLRTVQGLLSGIGFLGAGVIMRAQGKEEVHGLTTATSIWVCTILGVICGVGQWLLAACVFGISWSILLGGRWLEHRILAFVPQRNEEPISKKPSSEISTP